MFSSRRRIPFEKVGAEKIDLGVIAAQLSSNFNGRCLLIDGVDVNGNILSSRIINNQPRDVARPGGDVQNARLPVRLEPALQEISHQAVAAEPAIEGANVGEI